MLIVNEHEIAHCYLARFGSEASEVALYRAEALAAAGDVPGEAMWLEVARLVAQFEAILFSDTFSTAQPSAADLTGADLDPQRWRTLRRGFGPEDEFGPL